MPSTTIAQANVQQAVPFFRVHDLERSLRFYVDEVGFQMTRDWVEDGRRRWCWLELGGAGMMIEEFRRDGRHRNVPEATVGLGVTIAFICRDALVFYREIEARGGSATRPFVGNGMWVTELVDPDGYHLLFESPTDVAEETIFTDELH